MTPMVKFPVGGGGRKGKSRGKGKGKKKNTNPNSKTNVTPTPADLGPKVPKSIVLSRGDIGRTVRRLEQDIRRLMLPHTAAKLKESKRNSMKDFLHIAGPLGVTHFLLLSASRLAPYLRIARTPRGPTLTFKIAQYSLAADVANAQSRPRVPPHVFEAPPLLVMQGFGTGDRGGPQQQHLKLISIMFQNMFPAIDVSAVKLSECRRVVLLSHDPATSTLELRHYTVRAKPLGVSRPIRKLVESHSVPDLSGFADVSEFITRGGYGSESEAEDDASHVRLPQDLDRSNRAAQQSAVQLHELGPRLTLELVKVEEGLCGGEVMFHKYVKKTKEELAAQRSEREKKDTLRKQRKQQQEENVRRKEQEKQHQRDASRQAAGLPAKSSAAEATAESDSDGDVGGGEEEGRVGTGGARDWANKDYDDEEDNAEYYRKEVGEEPEPRGNTGRRPTFGKRKQFGPNSFQKKRKPFSR